MKKIINIITAFIVSIIGIMSPITIFADGMVIKPYPNDWQYFDESVQQVYINYKEGRQTMLLSIGLSSMTDNLVWIFPLPASHESVVVDNNITSMPNIYGTDILQNADDSITNMQLALSMNQIYPIALLPFLHAMDPVYPITMSDIAPLGSTMMEFNSTQNKDTVTVYEHIENNGVVTELLTSDSSSVLQEYFDSKYLNISADELTSLSEYYGDNYTFVVSYLTKPVRTYPTKYPYPTIDPQPIYEDGYEYPDTYNYNYNYYLNSTRGLLVSFPTDRMYFPLVPTSVYGSKIVPAYIKVMGLVTPKIYDDIKAYTDVNYYKTLSRYSLPVGFLADEDNYLDSDETYTLIKINAPSKLLTQDLFIDNIAPINVVVGNIVNTYPIGFMLLPLVLNSVIAGTLVSLVIFKEARSRKIWKYILLGFTNIFSLAFTVFILFFLPTKDIKQEDKGIMDELKRKGYNINTLRMSDWRKLLFLPLFSITYLLLTVVGAEILKLMI